MIQPYGPKNGIIKHSRTLDLHHSNFDNTSKHVKKWRLFLPLDNDFVYADFVHQQHSSIKCRNHSSINCREKPPLQALIKLHKNYIIKISKAMNEQLWNMPKLRRKNVYMWNLQIMSCMWLIKFYSSPPLDNIFVVRKNYCFYTPPIDHKIFGKFKKGVSMFFLLVVQPKNIWFCVSKSMHICVLFFMVHLSTPKTLAIPCPLLIDCEDANVHTISFANTRLDRRLPIKWMVNPSFKLPIISWFYFIIEA